MRPGDDRGADPLRVVVAEDQALLRVGLTRILEAGGFEVVAAVDNEPALVRALADPAVDVAVLDVRMPPSYSTEGLVAAVEARRDRPGFPVLVLSQYVEPLYARELLASGEECLLVGDGATRYAEVFEGMSRIEFAGDAVVVRSPIPPAIRRLDGRLVPLSRQLRACLFDLLQVVEELQKHHPGQHRQAVKVAVQPLVLTHDVTSRLDEAAKLLGRRLGLFSLLDFLLCHVGRPGLSRRLKQLVSVCQHRHLVLSPPA